MSLRTERDGAFAVWTIVRPETKNSLDFATLDALYGAIVDAGNDRNLRAVVLTGAGDTFVSGGDLRELKNALSATDGERLADAGRRVTQGLADLDVPVIAALPGPAVGGGAELALACDMRIAEARARLCFKHVRMGVTTAWGTTPRLLAMVGPGLAARLLFTGHDLSAAEAYAFRLVDAVVTNGTAVTQALAWAYDITQGSPEAIAHTKALLREAQGMGSPLWDAERERFVRSWVSPDHVEAMAAFFARKAPVWKPR